MIIYDNSNFGLDKECDECSRPGKEVGNLIALNDDDYDYDMVLICKDCLKKALEMLMSDKEDYDWVMGFVKDNAPEILTIKDMEEKNKRSQGDSGKLPSSVDIQWFKRHHPYGVKYHELIQSFPEDEDRTDWMWDMEGP